MKIKEIEMSDFSLVEVKTTNECKPTPHCKKHGAMNKISLNEDGGGTWRCISVIGYQNVISETGGMGKKEIEGVCRAGCMQI